MLLKILILLQPLSLCSVINLKLPTKLQYGRKEYKIQLNPYRNWCHNLNSNLKKKYTNDLMEILKQLDPLEAPVRLSYTLVVKDKRRRDLDGMTFIVHKFFADALIEAGLIPDDNVSIIDRIWFESVRTDTGIKDPYEVWVTIYDKKDFNYD